MGETPRNHNRHLTSGRLLARNTVWNFVGQFLPLAVGLVAVPPLVQGLGTARFGVLSLAWIVIGYFSLFDLGIGRALTKLIADKLAAKDDGSIPPLAWTALLLMLVLGSIGSLVLSCIASWLSYRMLKVPAELRLETLQSFYLLALSIPMVTVTSGLRGILEALQRFRMLNLIRIPMSVFSFAGPLLVLPFSHNLVPVVAVLVVGRVVGVLVHLFACWYALPALWEDFGIRRSIVGPVAKFGGWITVSNVVGPIMLYVDRFLIGTLVSVSAIAFYTAPVDMVTRLWIIPGALVAVVFPAFSITSVQDPDRMALLLGRATKYTFLAVFPIVLAISTLAPEGLRVWLGPTFAEQSSSVLRWVAAGVLVNTFASVAFAFIQSTGRPDITAKLHLLELSPYLLLVWLLTKHYGILGTAVTWFTRNAIDAFVVCLLARRFLPGRPRIRPALLAASTAGLLLYLGTLPHTMIAKAEFLTVALLGFAFAGWFLILVPEERAFLAAAGRVLSPKLDGI